jgi:hypothetical protein
MCLMVWIRTSVPVPDPGGPPSRGRSRLRVHREVAANAPIHAQLTSPHVTYVGSHNHRCKTMKALLGKARDYLDRYLWRQVTGAAPVVQMAGDQQAA